VSSPKKSLETRLVPFFIVLIPLHSPNLQSIPFCSTSNDSISGHGQPTQTPKKYLCYSDLSHQNLIDNMRRHGFFSPLPHAHNLSTQFNLTLVLPNFLSSPLPPSPPLSCPRLHRMIFTTKYVRVCLTNIRCFFVTYVTQDGIWTAYSHPLPPSHLEPGNVPYASRATSYPRQPHDTFNFLPLFSISSLTKMI